MLKERIKAGHVKSTGLATTIHTPNFGDDENLVAPLKMEVKHIESSEIDKGYAPFMSDGFVRLSGGDKKVPVKILRDFTHICEAGNFALFAPFRYRGLYSSQRDGFDNSFCACT